MARNLISDIKYLTNGDSIAKNPKVDHSKINKRKHTINKHMFNEKSKM